MDRGELNTVITACNSLFYSLNRRVIVATMFSMSVLLDVTPDELRELADGEEVTEEAISNGDCIRYSFKRYGWKFECIVRCE